MEEAGATGRTFEFGDADYLLVVEIDDFQDTMETKTFAALGKTVTSRTLRFAGITTIYNAKTNAVIETANINVDETAPEEVRGATTGDTRDAIMRELTRRNSPSRPHSTLPTSSIPPVSSPRPTRR